MAGIINASINLSEIPKNRIIDGKKGKYLPITITINDEVDNFGNHGPIIVQQTKEERDAKSPKVYLGNVKVAWTNGEFPKPVSMGPETNKVQTGTAAVSEDDLPF